MARHGIVNKEGKVVNVVLWDGAPWQPPADHYVLAHEKVDIGDHYDLATGKLTKHYDLAK